MKTTMTLFAIATMTLFASITSTHAQTCNAGMLLNPGESCILSNDRSVDLPRLEVGTIQDPEPDGRYGACLDRNRTTMEFAGARILDPPRSCISGIGGESITDARSPSYSIVVCAEGSVWRVEYLSIGAPPNWNVFPRAALARCRQ